MSALFSGVVLAHSGSIRLTLNSLKEIRLAHIQMHISSKTPLHEWAGERSAQEPGETLVTEDPVTYVNQPGGRKGGGGEEEEVAGGWGVLRGGGG